MVWTLKIRTFFLLVIAAIFLSACGNIKPYQRAFLDDRDMKFEYNAGEKFEQDAHSYREGAAGGNMGKSSGGCGCN